MSIWHPLEVVGGGSHGSGTQLQVVKKILLFSA